MEASAEVCGAGRGDRWRGDEGGVSFPGRSGGCARAAGRSSRWRGSWMCTGCAPTGEGWHPPGASARWRPHGSPWDGPCARRCTAATAVAALREGGAKARPRAPGLTSPHEPRASGTHAKTAAGPPPPRGSCRPWAARGKAPSRSGGSAKAERPDRRPVQHSPPPPGARGRSRGCADGPEGSPLLRSVALRKRRCV
jgi:hypothetical protein